MRRSIGALLLTLGFFGLALAPLLRFYAAPKLIVAPVNENTKIVLSGQNGSYLSTTAGQLVQAPLISTTTLLGVSKASTSSNAVWDYFSSLEDAARGTDLADDTWRMTFDRSTVQLKTCCGGQVQGKPGVKQTGLAMLFPLGTVEKKTYQRFDPVTERAWPTAYKGQEKIGGINAYKFTERIDPTSIEKQQGIPGSVIGLDAKTNYDLDKMYAADITLWVDPRSGIVIDMRQVLDVKVVTSDGQQVPALTGDLRMTDATRKTLIDKANDNASKIHQIRTTGPLISLLVGAVLLIAGALLLRIRRRGEHAAIDSEKTVTEPV